MADGLGVATTIGAGSRIDVGSRVDVGLSSGLVVGAGMEVGTAVGVPVATGGGVAVSVGSGAGSAGVGTTGVRVVGIAVADDDGEEVGGRSVADLDAVRAEHHQRRAEGVDLRQDGGLLRVSAVPGRGRRTGRPHAV